MSTTHPAASAATPSRTQLARRPMPAWLREPLLHFLILGAVLFGIDHLRAAGRDTSHLIVVGEDVDREASTLFEKSRGRAPNADELKALRQVWLDNEVLYREGLAMQVDRGDTAIRERVIFKALSVVDANVKLPEISDADLRVWFEARRAKYDEPARYDFQEAVLPGTPSEAEVRTFVAALNGVAAGGTPGSTQADLRVYKGRPKANLDQSFGADFAAALAASAPNEWHALPTRDGWRAIRLDAIAQPQPADFLELRGIVLQDWKDAVASDQRTAAVREMAKKYTIRIGSPASTAAP